MARKKHKTPKHLDHLFERHVITKASYGEYWSGYWDARGKRERDRYTDRFVSDLQTQLPFGKRKSGTITISRIAAEEQARNIGGYVVRRNAHGRFSKTGWHYQAIIRRKKEK